MLKNSITKNVIIKNYSYAKTFIDRFLGLHINDKEKVLLFNTRFGIHTIFLSKTIDILILDNDFKVVKIKKNLHPNRFYFWNPKYQYIVELPQNFIENHNINLSDTLIFDPPI